MAATVKKEFRTLIGMEKNFTPMWVVAAAISDGSGHWLMHRRPPGKPHAGLWEFPGGKVEAGESPRAALVREIQEEAGIELNASHLVESGFAAGRHGSSSETDIVILLYTATQWVGTVEAREGGELEWCDPAKIATLAMPPLDVVLARQLLENSG